MRYQCIEKQKKAWPITLMCGVLNVSRSGYDDWTGRGLSEHGRLNNERDRRIGAIFVAHRQRYGAPRIVAALNDEGLMYSENRIARRRRTLGLKAIQAKKFNVTIDSNHSQPVAPDRLEQDFSAAAPNQKWTSDLTSVWTDEGWLYLAVVMDLSSRAIVEWAMNRRMTQHLVGSALTMALFRRGFPKNTIIHSDRGSQYGSRPYQRLIKTNRLRGSMGRRATGYDNAVTESFFHTLKVELVHRER
jgi:putative transposase